MLREDLRGVKRDELQDHFKARQPVLLGQVSVTQSGDMVTVWVIDNAD